MKRFGLYLVYSIFICTITFLGFKYGNYLKDMASRDFNPYPAWAFIVLYPIFLGLLFGVPRFLSNMRMIGQLFFDWPKFFAFGFPTLILSLGRLNFYNEVFKYLPPIYVHMNEQIFTITGIVSGYVFLTSFGRATKNNSLSQ